MEEKKKVKLSYEELEAYANQTLETAKKFFEENKRLKELLADARMQMNYADIEYAFKVLDHKDLFHKHFVNKIVARLEIILDPEAQEESSKEAPKKASKETETVKQESSEKK